MNALVVLTDEHKVLRPILARLRQVAESGPDDELAAALASAQIMLGPTLDRHIALEDLTVFPLIAQSLGESLVQIFIDDHRRIEDVRHTLYTSSGSKVRGLTLTLEDLLSDHLAREENMLFASAEHALSPEELDIDRS